MTDSENLAPRRSTRLRSGTTSSTNKPASLDSPKATSPLRISKNNTKSKVPTEDNTLRDVSPGSFRRNSPSTLQIKDKVAAIESSSATRSPPTSPPLGMAKSDSAGSIRNFWQNGATDENSTDGKRRSKVEGDDFKTIRGSLVKNNIFLAKDQKERESSPKLTMSPSQQRLGTSFTEPATPTAPSRIPVPVEASHSPRIESPRPTNSPVPGSDATPKASCLHSSRIKGPRQNASDSESSIDIMDRRERRKTVTFDEAPQVLQFDRRSSHGTMSSEHSSASESQPVVERPLPFLPPRPLPQVPIIDSDDERPSSSNDSEYSDMEERIRSMMERVVLRDAKQPDQTEHEDIFSLYTTTNDMEDDEPHSQESALFSQATDSTAMSSQLYSQDESERQLALQKQSEELLEVMKSRPLSIGGLPQLRFGEESDEELGGLGLRNFCSETVDKPQTVANATTLPSLTIPAKGPVQEEDNLTPPITPPLDSSEIRPSTPQDQILPPPEQLPSTPPASPHKSNPDEEDTAPSPIVPEREATIRSRGGSKLRVRPSLSRQEAESIVARRRKSDLPPVPPLNDIREQSVEPEVKVKVEEDDLSEFGGKLPPAPKLDLPLPKIDALGFEESGGDTFGEIAVEEMERVIEAQKRGYMMRQHSKVVHASSDDTDKRSSKISERMASSVSVEWGSKRAPQNPIRKTVPQHTARKPSKELPSAPTATKDNGHAHVTSKESEAVGAPMPKKNASGEYGRLFIKVVKLKELELPLPKDESLYFSCTLDNGLHCVTTPFKLLQKEAKIDQEFELIATDKLEFMLTLQVRINLPPAPTKSKGTLGKQALQRIFGSPKKKATTPVPPAKDPYHGLGGIIGRDGSFSRSYIALKTYENAAYGRQFTTDVPCLNEWALEPGAVAMRGREVQRMRKRPYLIGKIECQLLFVPCINPAEELPKSMSAAIREMKNAEWCGQLLWEGYLSQQGGDCQHWRRRYFKLIGSSLVGYHESTRARRATINLAKSTRVVDDRESLIETPPVRARGQRRKSAFHSDEVEGYMYLEEGFRIWFANGEVIDFRADTREEKREWVNVLQGVVGKVPARKEWADAVLQRERALKK